MTKSAKTVGCADFEAQVVQQQLKEIIENDKLLDEKILEEVLVDKHKHMSFTDWEKAQDANPAIRLLRELMTEFGKFSPNKTQTLCS